VTASGLLICGLCHTFTIAEKLRELFELEIHVYDPRRIYNWDGRRECLPRPLLQSHSELREESGKSRVHEVSPDFHALLYVPISRMPILKNSNFLFRLR